MTVLLCVVASAAGFYLSTGLGDVWWLAWIAPVPVLWLAFGETRGWTAFFAAWAAGALGAGNLLPVYWGTLPAPVLVLAVVGTGLAFAASAIGGRLALRLSPLMGPLAFAALWTGFDYFAAQGVNGASLSPAYSQVGAPFLIQGASVFGLWVVTFLIGAVSAGFALALVERRALPALIAAALFVVNAGAGALRIAEAPKTLALQVGLAADDSLIAQGFHADEKSTLAVARAYADAARTLTREGASLIVFPEKLAVLTPKSRGAVFAEFVTVAHITHTTIVAGFDDRRAERRNDAVVFFPTGSPPLVYDKRRLVPGLEDAFVPGRASLMLGDRTAIAICKDMDFPAMLRADALLRPTLTTVPAWDFGGDRWWHARLAILRGVENGFAVARSAKDGLLTLSDAYGRVVAMKRSDAHGMVTLVGRLPRGPGHTFYARIGDAFAWLSIGLAALLLGLALRTGPTAVPRPGGDVIRTP